MRECQSVDRLSMLSSHLLRRADIALIGLAVMVSNEMCKVLCRSTSCLVVQYIHECLVAAMHDFCKI